jgi:Family of unknown function (DUF5372)
MQGALEPEASIGAVEVVIVGELDEHSVEVPLIDDDHVIEALFVGSSERAARRWHWRQPSTATGGDPPGRFRITHPYHPQTGQEFELFGYAHTWGEHRVFSLKPGTDRVESVPASWTDVGGADPFVVVAAGRSFFRVEDLLVLAEQLRQLAGGGEGGQEGIRTQAARA